MCEEDIKEMAAAESTERAAMKSLICKRRLAFDDIIGHRTVLSYSRLAFGHSSETPPMNTMAVAASRRQTLKLPSQSTSIE